MVTLTNLNFKRRIIYKYRELLSKKFTEQSTLTLLSLMFELTPTGFETYIAEYLKEISHFDKAKVTGGYKDGGIDIKAEKNDYFYAIQCKKYGTSHVKQKDILDFVENTKDLKEKYKNKIRFYFITTSWINKYAKNIAKKNGINTKCYKDILKIEKQYPINDFIKKHKGDAKILEGIDVEDVLNVFYIRKGLGRVWLADFSYFIFKFFKITDNWHIDYQKIEKENKGNKNKEYVFLQKESPIAKKDTFIGEVKYKPKFRKTTKINSDYIKI